MIPAKQPLQLDVQDIIEAKRAKSEEILSKRKNKSPLVIFFNDVEISPSRTLIYSLAFFLFLLVVFRGYEIFPDIKPKELFLAPFFIITLFAGWLIGFLVREGDL